MTIYEYFETFTTDAEFADAMCAAWALYEEDFDAFTRWAEREGIDLTARDRDGAELLLVHWAWECEEG